RFVARSALRSETTRGTHPYRARPAAVRPEERAGPPRNRWSQLRGDWLLARHSCRDGQVTSGPGAREPAGAAEAGMTLLTCAAVRPRNAAIHGRALTGLEMKRLATPH